MIPLEAWVFLPASTGGVQVWEEVDGAPVVLEAEDGMPTLGLALTAPIQLKRSRLLIEVRGEGRSAHWESRPSVTAGWGMFGADMGWRWGPAEGAGSVPGLVETWWGAGGGARLGWMVAEPWSPWMAWGIGSTTSGGLSFGTGRVRPMVEVRLGLDIVAEAVTGTLDTAVVDMGWTWTPMAFNLAIRAGAGF